MHTVSVINYKGGVGKTALATNLAAELGYRGRSVLLIDLDPQASLTFSLITPEAWQSKFAESRTIKRWFEAIANRETLDLDSLAFKPKRLNGRLGSGSVHLIASHLGLINVDLELATELSGATLKQAKRNYLKVHRMLLEGLSSISDGQYDLVLIDCPPNFNIVTKNAIVASDSVLVPAKPDYLSTLGIDYLIRHLRQLVSDYNEYAGLDHGEHVEAISPEVLGVAFTMVQFYAGRPIGSLRPYIAQTKKLSVPVFDSFIRENKTLFADAPQDGVPVVLRGYSAKTHKQVVGELEAFVTEFETRLGL